MVSLESFGKSVLFNAKSTGLRKMSLTPRPIMSKIVWGGPRTTRLTIGYTKLHLAPSAGSVAGSVKVGSGSFDLLSRIDNMLV